MIRDFLFWLIGYGSPTPRPNRVWLFKAWHGDQKWVVVVSPERPQKNSVCDEVLGPFRSEVDAEGSADRLNSRTTPSYQESPR